MIKIRTARTYVYIHIYINIILVGRKYFSLASKMAKSENLVQGPTLSDHILGYTFFCKEAVRVEIRVVDLENPRQIGSHCEWMYGKAERGSKVRGRLTEMEKVLQKRLIYCWRNIFWGII